MFSLKLEGKNEELKAIMILDPLTGAYNRLFLDGLLEKETHYIKRHGACISILLFDIDYFKKVNEMYGYRGATPIGWCSARSSFRGNSA